MELAEIMASEIRANGPMPFHRFMELALYHPRFGYYAGTRDPFGHEGDFYTNAQLQPVFGRLVAQQLDRWRRAMGSPDSFTVLELGPGRGETGDEIRRCMPDVNWIPVEHDGCWPDRPVVGAVFCNEFFDALPVDLVERRGNGWIEWRVGLSESGFAWQPGGCHVTRRGLPRIGEGRRIETCERQVAAMERIDSVLAQGWVLAIDYGYTHDEVERAGRFPDGSLMGYSRHRADPDVLVEPGRRDITAHVNFSALEDCGRAAGLEVFPLQTQQAFLLGVGEPDSFAYALAAGTEMRRTALRMLLKSLLFGLGETFRALVMRKG